MSDTERIVARERLVETLKRMAGGELSFIEGSRIASRLTDTAGFDRLSEPFVVFVAIDSETDAVPWGRCATCGIRMPSRSMPRIGAGQKHGRSKLANLLAEQLLS
ncbi:MAG TPA: hypothetical protein VFH89_12055 [Sphingomicrobium sp.]|nr:hypothetical protein [Sphingomicrobium sp.]